MANTLRVDLVVATEAGLANVDQFERRIVDTEKKITQMGKSGGDAGRELAQGLGIPLGPTAALLAGIGLLSVGITKAMQAAREGADANRVLSASATEAGLSYADATEKVLKFATQTGLSNTESKQTYSSIIQVAKVAGQVGDLDLIQKRFADLAAARGVAAKDLATLSQQILSGQDEALNRLGLADPSKLAAEWARAHGTTVEAMSQSEQVASRLDAVMRKGAMFDGSAEDRLKSVSGQITLTEQAMGNLTTGVGDAIFKNMEFREALQTVNEALQDIAISSDDVRAKLKSGLTPKQIAEGLVGEASTWDSIKGSITAPFAGLAVGKAQMFGSDQDVKDAIAAQELALDPGKRRLQQLEDQIEAEKRLVAQQEKDAAAQGKINEAKIQSDKDAAAAKIANADATKRLAAEEAAQKQNQETVTNTFKETQSFLDGMLERVNKDNPFVKLFSEADTVMERMQKRFGAFGDEFVNQMAKVETQAIAMEQLAARIQSTQKVLDLQAEIRKLQFGQIGTSAEDQRRLGVFDKRIAAARDIPGLEASARAVEQGRSPTDVDTGAILSKQIDEIRKLKDTFSGSAFGKRDAQSKFNEQIIALFAGATPQQQAALLRGGDFRGDLSGAYQGQADDRTQAIKDELRRAEFARMDVELAQRKLADLNRVGGLDNDEVRKQYLAVTGGLNANELTPEMRTGRIGALQAEAKKEAEKEKKAEEDRKLLNEVLGAMKKSITAKGFKTDLADASVLVEVKDTSSKASVTGPAFDSGSLADQMSMR